MLKTDMKHFQVRCDDTDTFVLLFYYFRKQKPAALITMKRFDAPVIRYKLIKQRGTIVDLKIFLPCMLSLVVTALLIHLERTKTLASVLFKNMVIYIGLEVFGEEVSTKENVIKAGITFFEYLCGSKLPIKTNPLRHKLFTKHQEFSTNG